MPQNKFHINTEVVVVGMEEHIGFGVVNGNGSEDEAVVRFKNSTIDKQGEKYLKGLTCLTKKYNASRLYLVPVKYLELRRNEKKTRKDT